MDKRKAFVLITFVCSLWIMYVGYKVWNTLNLRIPMKIMSDNRINNFYSPSKESENYGRHATRFKYKVTPYQNIKNEGGPINSREDQYARFQRLNDNKTAVYVGYYDDNEQQAVVKIIAVVKKKTQHNFTCTFQFTEQDSVETIGYIRLFDFQVLPNQKNYLYRDGFIVCPVSRQHDVPSFVLLKTEGTDSGQTNVTIKAPSSTRETVVTRCLQPLINNYDNIQQLIWNIELFQILGVDKHIFYLDNQTQRVVDVLKTYQEDGIVEIRNFSLTRPKSQPPFWIQLSAFHDCTLSQMKRSKYVLFFDLDEMLFPRKHKNISEMADFLFTDDRSNPKQVGALTFRCVFFPAYTNITNATFPLKDTALVYNIVPLLHTERYATAPYYAMTKTLIKPKTVDVMFVHYVEKFKPGWRRIIVDDKVGTVNHYRARPNRYMFPPITTDKSLLKFSDMLISRIQKRFERIKEHSSGL